MLQIGLCYSPAGIGILISVVGTGKYLNWINRLKYKKYTKWLKEKEDLLNDKYNDRETVKNIMENDPYCSINLVEARMSSAFLTLLVGVVSYIAYGWCLNAKTPLVSLLVTSDFASIFSNCILTILIVDLFPSHASTRTGCLNLFKCSYSALFIGCLKLMV